MRLFGIGVTCNDRVALIVVLQVLEREKIPSLFFSFYGKDVEDRTATPL